MSARALLSMTIVLSCAAGARAQEAATALYVRTDSDETTVITPRLRAKTPITEQASAEVVYMVDVWTSASIDVRTSASLALTKPRPEIVEQRDELDVTAGYELEDTRLSLGYRYSTEPDYQSHGGGLAIEQDFAERATTLGASLSANRDEVGRVGDPRFERTLDALRMRVSLAQAITRSTVAELAYEVAHEAGYLASPYRYVGVGSEDGSCHGEEVMLCAPETSPDVRLRHALALRAKQALGELLSAGGGYRFYTDDWQLDSHTAELELSLLPLAGSLIELQYRFYTQGAAKHYRPRFEEPSEDGLYTRDKELSPMHAHRVLLALEQAIVIGNDAELSLALSLGPTFYEYRDFVPLDSITAWETTFALGFAR